MTAGTTPSKQQPERLAASTGSRSRRPGARAPAAGPGVWSKSSSTSTVQATKSIGHEPLERSRGMPSVSSMSAKKASQ